MIGTIPIPISVFGLLLDDQIETGARSLTLIGFTLIALGLLLLVVDWTARHVRPIERITRRDGIVVGFAQAAALIPGVSRSGATITAGLFLGLTREAVARFSFLLSVPAVVLSGLYQAVSLETGTSEGDASWLAIGVATFVAFVVGYASIAFLLRWLVRHTMLIFVVYRVALGVLVLVLVWRGAIE